MTALKEAAQQALDALESYSKSDYIKQQHPKRRAAGDKAITALRTALAEQPAHMPAMSDDDIKRHGERASRMMAKELTRFDAACEVLNYLRGSIAPYYILHRMHIVLHGNPEAEQTAHVVPPGHVVVKDEPVARMLAWKGPLPAPRQQKIARTYAEFPEDAALPANKEAYWENAEPLYAARPGKKIP